jgi:hypothetical protein
VPSNLSGCTALWKVSTPEDVSVHNNLNECDLIPCLRSADSLECARSDAVLDGLMSLDGVALLAPRMNSDAAAILATRNFSWQFGERDGFFAGGHLQLGPPRCAPWVREEFVANPIIEQVAAAILGPSPFLSWFNGNCNCPGSGSQVLHPDHEWAFQNAEEAAASGHPWPHRATTINVNWGTAHVDSSNGGTEVWPVRIPP